MNRILLTGSNGFIGSKLCHYFNTKGDNQVIPFEGSLLDLKNAKEQLVGKEIDIVIHLAGLISGNSSNIWEVNTMGTINLLTAIESLNTIPRLIINMGSSAEYGIGGESIIEEVDCKPKGDYGKSKLVASNIIKYWCLTNKLPGIHLRLFNAIGEDMHKMLPGYLNSLFKADSNNIEVKISNLLSARDWVSVHDIAQIIEGLFTFKEGFETFNLSTNKSTTNLDLIKMFAQVSKKSFTTIEENTNPDIFVGDNSKLMKYLKNFQFDLDLTKIVNNLYNNHSK